MPADMKKLPYIVAVDFDGTIVESQFPSIGSPRTKFVTELQWLMSNHPDWKFVLWTTRNNNKHGNYLDDAVEYCKSIGLRFDAINRNVDEVIEMFGSDTRKVFANTYLDDSAFFENPSEICERRFDWYVGKNNTR